MIAIGDERRTRQPFACPQPHLRGQLIADETDDPGSCEHPQMRQLLRVNQTLDRLVQRDTRGDEDREHDREPGELLAAEAAQEEGDPERYRRQRITEVVDQVREQGNRTGEDKDHNLYKRGCAQQRKAQRDRLDSFVRPDDQWIDEAMGMAVTVLMVVAVPVLASHVVERTRRPWREHVPVGPRVCVAMDVTAVAVTEGR